MKCPQCGVEISNDQNFCGDCGQQLNTLCPGCSISNPLSYKFCGKCGRKLAEAGSLVLDRSGLILEADDTALDILSTEKSITIIGKPFSLLVSAGEMALFYSHWNELLRTDRSQTLELKLTPAHGGVIHAKLILTHMDNEGGNKTELISITIDDVTNRRQSAKKLQKKNDLLDSITFITNLLHPANRRERRKTIEEVLAKIGNSLEGDYIFIARFDEKSEQVFVEFNWHASSRRKEKVGITAIATDHFRPILNQLKTGQPYGAGNIQSLPLSERQIWKTWHQHHIEAIHCEMIYHDKKPVGLIGISKSKAGIWPQTSRMLIKLAGNLMAETLSLTPADISLALLSPTIVEPSNTKKADEQAMETRQLDDIEIMIAEQVEFQDDHIEVMVDEQVEIQDYSYLALQMEIIPDAHGDLDSCIPVFNTDDDVCSLTCLECKRQEFIALTLFEDYGWVLKINCPCGHSFRVFHEMRQTFRKDVHLHGQFAKKSNDMNKLAVSGSWSVMDVTNISRNGLNFTSHLAITLKVGELIKLKFNLDNNKKTLIEKTAEIKSIRENNIGCHFQGSDQHDVTLGFYFL